MDLNELYFEHQILLMQAEGTRVPYEAVLHRRGAAVVARRIGCIQRSTGAAAGEAWRAMAGDGSRPAVDQESGT